MLTVNFRWAQDHQYTKGVGFTSEPHLWSKGKGYNIHEYGPTFFGRAIYPLHLNLTKRVLI